MARSIDTILKSIRTAWMANETLSQMYGFTLNSTFEAFYSKVSVEAILTYIIASVNYTLEVLFDSFTTQVNSSLDERLTHGLSWYASISKLFQYGYSLNPLTLEYDTEDVDAQIIDYSAVTEDAVGIVTIKVAHDNGTTLVGIDNLVAYPNADELFAIYIKKVKDAGVKIRIITTNGDDLKASLKVWYDPLLIGSDGKLLNDSSKEPARDAIKEFIKNLPFNGEFIPADMEDMVQAAQGIDIAELLSCETRFGANEFEAVDGKMIPYGGYLKIANESDVTITYVANAD